MGIFFITFKIIMQKYIILLIFFFFTKNILSQSFISARRTSGVNNEYAKSIAKDQIGNIYTVGTFSGTVNFDFGISNQFANSIGDDDIYITKHDTDGNLVWVKSIGGIYSDEVYSITFDNNDNFFILGTIQPFNDLDPGVGTYTIDVSTSSFCIAKYNTAGSILWAKSLGSYSVKPTSLALDNANNIIVVGNFTGNITGSLDFDGGIGTYTIAALSNTVTGRYNNGFISKLDPTGSVLWVKSVQSEEINSVTCDQVGNIYTTGAYNGVTDFDPGVGTYSLTNNSDMFILKLDDNGVFHWVKHLGGAMRKGTIIKTGPLNNIYALGKSYSGGDIDPNSGIVLSSAGIYIINLDTAGNTIWAKALANSISSSSNLYVSSIDLDNSGNIYTVGYIFPNSGNMADFDPGPGQALLYETNFVSKLNSSGNLVWAKNITGGVVGFGLYAAARGIVVDNNGAIIITGDFFGTVDFDPDYPVISAASSSALKTDAYFLRLNQDYCSNLTLTIDSISNINCVSNQGYCYSHVSGGLPSYTYIWSNSTSQNSSVGTFTNSGIYQLLVKDTNNCQRASSFLINTYGITAAFDLSSGISCNAFRPGVQSNIWLYTFNSGCINASGQTKILLDSLLTFNTSNPLPDFVSGDTLIWNFTNICYDSTIQAIYISVTTSSAAIINDTINIKTIVTPLGGDIDITNNIKQFSPVIVNSYDPNDKRVYPVGQCATFDVLKSKKLTYTIRFQNTGNANAINIHILDSLDSGLDISTLNVLYSSHQMYTEILNGNVLDFHFSNIQLPDSFSNEPNSHGYIVYEILPISTLSDGVEIENRAYIYFDFNEPVITNMVTNTVYDVLQNNCIDVSVNELSDSLQILLYPNPTSGIFNIKFEKIQRNVKVDVLNVLGELIYSFSESDKSNINLRLDEENGIYLVKVINESNEIFTFKILKE